MAIGREKRIENVARKRQSGRVVYFSNLLCVFAECGLLAVGVVLFGGSPSKDPPGSPGVDIVG